MSKCPDKRNPSGEHERDDGVKPRCRHCGQLMRLQYFGEWLAGNGELLIDILSDIEYGTTVERIRIEWEDL